MMPGKGRMIVTGNLRDVMKESISRLYKEGARRWPRYFSPVRQHIARRPPA
jgi:Lon protease (S16) C-terminal proteolytic domain